MLLSSTGITHVLPTAVFNIFFVRAMAARIPTPSPDAPGLVITAVNPGWCRTQLMREFNGTITVSHPFNIIFEVPS